MPAYFENANGSIREFTEDEIAAMEIETLGVRDGSHPTHTRDVNASTVEAEYLVKFSKFEEFFAFMLGAQKLYTDGVQKISRLPPQRWPRTYGSEDDSFVAVKIPRATGHKIFGDNVLETNFPIPEYTHMRVSVLFQHCPFDIETDADTTVETQRYVQTLPSQHETSYLTLPCGVMQYKTAGGGAPHGNQIPYNIGFPIPQSTISRKWIRLPFGAWGPGTTLFNRVNGDQVAGTKPYVGSVNLTAFMGYPAGHLLYLGLEEELQLDPLGEDFSWNLTHKWLVKYYAPHTWFYFHPIAAADAALAGWYYAAKTGAAHRATVATMLDDESLFHAREHANLFKVS
jgi:hypothetical protein